MKYYTAKHNADTYVGCSRLQTYRDSVWFTCLPFFCVLYDEKQEPVCFALAMSVVLPLNKPCGKLASYWFPTWLVILHFLINTLLKISLLLTVWHPLRHEIHTPCPMLSLLLSSHFFLSLLPWFSKSQISREQHSASPGNYPARNVLPIPWNPWKCIFLDFYVGE